MWIGGGLLGFDDESRERPWRSIVPRVTRAATGSCVGIPYRCASDQTRQGRCGKGGGVNDVHHISGDNGEGGDHLIVAVS